MRSHGPAVRPDRPDIAAPELPPRLRWAGEAPGSMAEMTAGGPVLVWFFDFAQLNSVRTLPYVVEWAEPLSRARPDGRRGPDAAAGLRGWG